MIYILSTVVLLGLLIFVHELGHFSVAKALGVRVERFSLGFPPKMIGKKIGETEYMISWIPLGGYVKMFGENPDEIDSVPPEEQHRSFSHKPAWARFLIVFAGPGFNLIFTFFVLWMIFWAAGIEMTSPVVGRITPDGPAARAGIEPGDRIVSINGQAIDDFSQIVALVGEAKDKNLTVVYERAGKNLTTDMRPEKVDAETIFGDTEEAWRIGITAYLPPVVGAIQGDMPADEADIKPGDRITAINDNPVRDWYDVLRIIRESQGKPLDFQIARDGKSMTTTITPKMESIQDAQGEFSRVPVVGLHNQAEIMPLGPVDAFVFAGEKTWTWLELTYTSIVKLFQRKVSAKTLGGPIFIAELAGKRAKAGLVELIYLAAFISLNLGLLNLLPIPVLDGGHLFFFGIEIIVRRPVSIRIRERAQQVGMVLLLTLMVFIFYNDIARLVTRWSQNSEAPAVEEPASPQSGNQ